jgi:hypothetical protein
MNRKQIVLDIPDGYELAEEKPRRVSYSEIYMDLGIPMLVERWHSQRRSINKYYVLRKIKQPKMVDEMPKEGQFVAVWEYSGEIWSEMLKHDKKFGLRSFDGINEIWVDAPTFKGLTPKYIILD